MYCQKVCALLILVCKTSTGSSASQALGIVLAVQVRFGQMLIDFETNAYMPSSSQALFLQTESALSERG